MSNWAAWPKNDRLKRWMIVDTDAPGKGKPVIADNIRSEHDAKLICEMFNSRRGES